MSARLGLVSCLAVLVLLSATSFAQCEGVHGDVNGDGVDTNLDALMIQARFLNLLSQYPIDANGDGRWPEETCTPRPTPTPTLGVGSERTVYLPGNVPLTLVYIPPGSFQMGSNDDPGWSWCYPCEQPVHPVTFDGGFWLGKYEVTQRQWEAVMGSNPSTLTGDLDAPVETVSWYDCQSFLTTLNSHVVATGQGPGTFRLPSEAEWEYACRAGTTTRFSFGDSNCDPGYVITCPSCDLSNYAWWCGNYFDWHEPRDTKPVGQKLPNAWGLYDMHGNVWEWCEDWWHDDYTGAPADGSAWIAPPGDRKVTRGGSAFDPSRYSRSAARVPYSVYGWEFYIGFRVASTP